MYNLLPWIIVALAFSGVALAVFVAGQYIRRHLQLQRRVLAGDNQTSGDPGPALLANLNAIVSTYFDEKRFGVQGAVRSKLRRDLVRAGFFRVDAVNYYILFKFASVIAFPLISYGFIEAFILNYSWALKLLLVAVATGIGILGPDAYIARRQRVLTERYRLAFPELLDLTVVCVDAGLSLEASLDRVSKELVKTDRELGMNLLLLEAETRAGRTITDALEGFADRLGLDEARSFVGTLRQSVELGTDIGDALRVFSDEMRDKRLLRAEEKANQLPVKMVLPLGLCIFPVILMVVMLPVVLRLITVLR